MPNEITCPHCGARMQSAREHGGEGFACGSCGREVGATQTAALKNAPWSTRRWYRNPLLWFLILIPVSDILAMLLSMVIPGVQQAREAGCRQQCLNNLHRIGQAMRLYHDVHGSFPPPYTVDETGKPLHSWRVLILPYLGDDVLYHRVCLDEPWDSPHNRRFATKMPTVYRCPSDPPDVSHHDTASYLMITGPGTVGDGRGGTALDEISDGPANTLFVAETREPEINWMRPSDFDAATMPRQVNRTGDSSAAASAGPSIASFHPGVVNVLFCDGSVRTLSDETDAKTVEALLTKDGGETVELPNIGCDSRSEFRCRLAERAVVDPSRPAEHFPGAKSGGVRTPNKETGK